jgi:RNA polymerase sigma-70 factor (ECF subfamily)
MARTPACSFEMLEKDYGDRIFRFCYRLCGHREDAEDLAQEALILAWKSLPQFQGRSSLATWLYRIALNRWRRTRRPPPSDADFDEATAADPTANRLLRLSLDRAMAELPETLRTAFVLVKAEGLKYREAAEVLDVPQGTVQSRVHEATLRLRALLSEELKPGEREERNAAPRLAEGGGG